MKQKITSILLCNLACLLFSITTFAQAPQAIPYQAVARNASGNILANQLISVRFGILDSVINGTILYKETQTLTTNSLGLFTANIGQGAVFFGTFNTINWGKNAKYIQVEMDATGGNNYVVMGVSQLMSVPYALSAKTTSSLPNGTAIGNTPYWDGSIWTNNNNNIYNNGGNIGIGTSNPSAKLHTTGSVRFEGLSGTGTRPLQADANGNIVTPIPIVISTPNAAIPDNGCATGNGLSNTIFLSGLPLSVPTASIKVRVNITHTFDADLAIFLTAPNGQILRLAQNNGSSGDNFTNTIFTDNAATSISTGTAPFSGSYKPIGGLGSYCTITPTVTNFSALGGGTINPIGIWVLRIIDGAGNDLGVLNSWSIEIPPYNSAGANNYVTKWENGALSNTSTMYDDGTNIGIGTISPEAQLHTTGSVRHETLSGLGTRVVFSDSLGNLVTNAPAFEGVAAGGNIMGNFNCNTYNQTISGAPTLVPSKSISVKINLTHSQLGNIGIFLEAPNGDKLRLCASYSGTGAINATYTDYSTVQSGLPPYNGVYKPDGDILGYPCNLVANLFNFEDIANGTINPNGVWKLWILDFGAPAGIQGNLINWSVMIGDSINRGYNGFFPKWINGNLSNGSYMFENSEGVGIHASKVSNELSVGGNADISGRLGIGNTSPQASLHVSGSGISTSVSSRGYFSVSTGSSIINNTASSGNIVIRADGWVWANGGGFVATSDKRIKNILSKTNNKNDLDVLNKIDITNYKYIDEISNGCKPQKKVIAQQVQEIYPIAINTSQGIIPDVFETAFSAEIKNNKTYIVTKKKHGFATGDEVKLILDQSGEKIVQATVINENTFSVDEIITEKIFVYGKKVNDLLTVDYDALTTLNISATQELAKENEELMKKIEALTTKYDGLQNQNTEMKSELTFLQQETNRKLKALEAMLSDKTQSNKLTTVSK